MPWRKLKITPRSARYYLLFALLCLCIPSFLTFYFPSHKGRFLVASGALQDRYFSKTLVYLTLHHALGAVGVIINKPLEGDDLAQAKDRFPMMDQFYFGGPVETQYSYYWLVPSDEGRHGFEIVAPIALQEEDPARYNEIVAMPDVAKTVRVYKGISSWSPMQLNREIFYGGWNAIDYDAELMFDTPHGEIWPEALSRVLKVKKISDERI